MCRDRFSKILAFIGALVAGIVAALLVNGGVLTDPAPITYVLLGLAAVCIICAILLILTRRRFGECLCQYLGSVLYAGAIAAVLAGVLLSMDLAAVSLPVTVVFGATVTLAVFALLLLCLLCGCILRAHCGCDCGCGGTDGNSCGQQRRMQQTGCGFADTAAERDRAERYGQKADRDRDDSCGERCPLNRPSRFS